MSLRLTVAFLLLAVVLAAETGHDAEINYINMFIRLDEQAEYGLTRLTPGERARLNEIFGSIVERLNDNLRNSALAYLESQGWTRFDVLGTEELDLGDGPRRYVVAVKDAMDYVLQPEGYSTLAEGEYLGKVSGGTMELLNVQGAVVSLTVRMSGPANK